MVMMLLVFMSSRNRGRAVGVREGGTSRRRGRSGGGVVEGEVLSWRRGCGASEGHCRVIHHGCSLEMIG